jgi:exopolyphosphatase/guanosine-5'-triphosphate,3'-diphosphate pyrophosphatase
MRVGVIDVGANTVRLLVAAGGPGGIETLHRERARLGLGEHVEAGGVIPDFAIEAARRTVRKQAASARRLGCSRVAIVVTSPGRQAGNADELVASLERTRDTNVRVLTAEEEAVYAYRGALSVVDDVPETVGFCDVGGGSTQIVVGSRDGEPDWVRSLDLGSLRLTTRAGLGDPPKRKGIELARELVRPVFDGVEPPQPEAALAAGGSARAVARLVGDRLGPQELAIALRIVAERPSRRFAKTFELSLARARTLAAGTLLLATVQSLLGVPLTVARGGLREGIALSLFEEEAVAA